MANDPAWPATPPGQRPRLAGDPAWLATPTLGLSLLTPNLVSHAPISRATAEVGRQDYTEEFKADLEFVTSPACPDGKAHLKQMSIIAGLVPPDKEEGPAERSSKKTTKLVVELEAALSRNITLVAENTALTAQQTALTTQNTAVMEQNTALQANNDALMEENITLLWAAAFFFAPDANMPWLFEGSAKLEKFSNEEFFGP